ncbi:MAG: metallophosphoesterase [Pikeienuella sp.]
MADQVRIIALGDMPYGAPSEVYPPYRALIAKINQEKPDLVIHVGDTKTGSSPCTDQLLLEQLAFLNDFTAPTIYTPGDNEWTDCHRDKAGRYDPYERLAFIRQHYFSEPDLSFGVPTPIAFQADYPENSRIKLPGVMVIAAHVTGSKNGKGQEASRKSDGFKQRTKGVIAWIEHGFARASSGDAVIVALHADMFTTKNFNSWKRSWRKKSAFKKVGSALAKAAATHNGPVLLIFGDTHEYRVFAPMPDKVPNWTAMEVYGGRSMHAVEVVIDPKASVPFVFDTVANPALP